MDSTRVYVRKKGVNRNILLQSSNQTHASRREVLLPLIQFVKKEYNLSKEELVKIYDGCEDKGIPVCIFSYLSPLEALVKYLKENLCMRFHEIAQQLNRDDRSIWHTYHHACLKAKLPLAVDDGSILIPIGIFKNRELSILENLSIYLKDELNIPISKICSLINKKSSTVWTAYNRAQRKNKISSGNDQEEKKPQE